MPPNNGILLNGVLRTRLINNLFASCSFLNLDFLLPHTAHFDDDIELPLIYHINDLILFQLLFLLNFCFKNLDLSVIQLAHLHLSLVTLFIIIAFFEPILPVCLLQLKQ